MKACGSSVDLVSKERDEWKCKGESGEHVAARGGRLR